MADGPGASFIPTRNPVKRSRKKNVSRVYVFSYVAYVLIFAAVLSAAGVFIYKLQLQASLVEKQKSLSTLIDSFSQSDLEMVKEFEHRLNFAGDRMDNHLATSQIFRLLEEAVVASVEIKDIQVTRDGDEEINVTASVVTDTYNSTIFQRDTFIDEDAFVAQFVGNVARKTETDETDTLNTGEEVIEAVVSLNLDSQAIAYIADTFSEQNDVVVPVEEVPVEADGVVEEESELPEVVDNPTDV
ncbi:MAG: hypothetical protein AAGA35_00790 [Patescibacteria group bacterium]